MRFNAIGQVSDLHARQLEHDLNGARERGLEMETPLDFAAVSGQGAHALVSGRKVSVGNARLMAGSGIDASAFHDEAARMAREGKSPLYIGIDGKAAGLLAVSDSVKPNAAAAIAKLQAPMRAARPRSNQTYQSHIYPEGDW